MRLGKGSAIERFQIKVVYRLTNSTQYNTSS